MNKDRLITNQQQEIDRLNRKIERLKERYKYIIQKNIDKLEPRETKVLKYRIYDELTLEEISMRVGVTRERIRQIEAKAIDKLRHGKFIN